MREKVGDNLHNAKMKKHILSTLHNPSMTKKEENGVNYSRSINEDPTYVM